MFQIQSSNKFYDKNVIAIKKLVLNSSNLGWKGFKKRLEFNFYSSSSISIEKVNRIFTQQKQL